MLHNAFAIAQAVSIAVREAARILIDNRFHHAFFILVPRFSIFKSSMPEL